MGFVAEFKRRIAVRIFVVLAAILFTPMYRDE